MCASRVFWLLLLVLVGLSRINALSGSLYAYAKYKGVTGLYVINPATGQATLQCNLTNSTLPPLASAAGAVNDASHEIYFYSEVGVIQFHTIQPSTCVSTTLQVANLSFGQNNVYDLKYDATGPRGSPVIYAAFSDPNCIHSSLDAVNPVTGSAYENIADVIAGSGLQQASGIDTKNSIYYYVSFVFPMTKKLACNEPLTGDLSFVLNVVALGTGTVQALPLTNNSIGVGEITVTLGYLQSNGILVGAGSPLNATEGCTPGCFFAINTTTGAVAPLLELSYATFVAAEIDQADGLVFQIVQDDNGDSFLLTFSPATKKLINSVACPICGSVTSLSFL